MSHGKIRNEKNCLNCNENVEKRFCPKCGQENIETRQPFHYLFTHFVEDFTHYDGQFWGTMKNLLFKPGKLTTIYLSGKRQQYVPPVKLYIFVSFITFFLPSLLPSGNNQDTNKKNKAISEIQTEKSKKESIETIKKLENIGVLDDEYSKKKMEEILNPKPEAENILSDENENKIFLGFKSLEEYDLEIKNDKDFVDKLFRPFVVKFFQLKEEGFTKKQIQQKFSEIFIRTLSKALFIYLPIFAFILWIFQEKKKWWYFDHGIFTLHYFSFLLISILVATFFNSIDNIVDNLFVAILQSLVFIAIIIYSMVYFFIAHHKVYQTTKRVTILKGFLIFLTNSICMSILLLGLLGLSFLMIH